MNKFTILGSGILVFTAGLITGLSSVGESSTVNCYIPDISSMVANGLPFTILMFVLVGVAAAFLTKGKFDNGEEDVKQ